MADTLIDLIRHGRVDGPAAMYGATDVALHPEGWQQLDAAMADIATPDVVISSPRRRCHQFADQYATRHGLALRVEQDLREYEFGEWDGIPFDQLFGDPEENPQGWQHLQAFAEAPAEYPPPGGERIEQVFDRCGAAFELLATQYQGSHMVVFCHAAVIRLILGRLLPVDWRSGRWFSQLSIAYASRTRIRLPEHPGAGAVVECIGWLPAGDRHIADPGDA